MPKETTTPVERGPGSISPDFSAPSVSVATPGLGLQAQPTEEERFFEAIKSFSRGVASAVSGRAAIEGRINALKEQSMAKVEQDLNRAARSFQARRLESADQARRGILASSLAAMLETVGKRSSTRLPRASALPDLWMFF